MNAAHRVPLQDLREYVLGWGPKNWNGPSTTVKIGYEEEKPPVEEISTRSWQPTFVLVLAGIPRPPLGYYLREALRLKTPAERFVWRAIKLSVLGIILAALFVPALRKEDAFHERPVSTEIVTSDNPAVCGVEGTAVSAVLVDPVSPKTYRVTCDSGVVLWDRVR